MGSFKILGFPDLFAMPSADVIAESEASSSMADDNMETEEPSEFWRSSSNTPNKTMFRGKLGIGGTFAASAAAVAGTNLWQNTCQLRFIVFSNDTSTPAGGQSAIVPDAIAASSNATGAVTTIDEGFTHGSDFMTPTTPASAWSVRLTFPTPSGNPRTGADYQSFWICAKNGTGDSAAYNSPTVTATLYEGGVLRAALGTKAITQGSSQWIYFTWNASSLSTANGSAVEVLLEFAAGTGGDAHLNAVVWHEEDTVISSAPTLVHDSGWVDLGTAVAQPGATEDYLSDTIDLYQAKLYDFGSELPTIGCIWVLIREDHAPDISAAGYNLVGVVVPPFGYVEVGKFLAGIVFTPAESFSFGDYLGFEELSSQEMSEEGQESGSRRGSRRVATLDLATLTTSEAAFLVERWVRRKGILSPVLVSLNHGDSVEENLTTFYATLRNPETQLRTKWASGQKRSLVLQIEEKL